MRNIVSSPLAMQCLSMEETKINYQKEQDKLLKVLKEKGEKPTLLLHVCCGPCFTYPFELIKEYFKITIIYNNSNIYPEEEYNRRLNELKGYLKAISADIDVIEFPYDNLNYNKDLEPYADQREGMDRCRICFRKRLGQAIEYAEEHNFDFVGTVMSISRFKNSQDLNKIGLELSKDKNVQWLPADFKKNGGYEKSLDIVRKFGLYFQHYCGCKFSIRAKKDEM